MRRSIAFFLLLIISGLLNSTLYYEKMFLVSTDFQFPVVRIEAEKDKKPVMLIFGGIHGNEPGAYLTAEKLTDLKLRKGTVIIVPRVNFYSIMKNVRGYFGDMNRKFVKGEEKKKKDPDSKIVKILKQLMSEADIFINLHDAWGFHKRYHKNFGQCIIVDAAKVYSKKFNREIDLEKIGKEVVRKVNKQIKNPDHLFAFWNTKTETKHKEKKLEAMKFTATFYAYKVYNIPAFGVESSKNIKSDELKVKYHLMVLNELFRVFGIIPKNKISPRLKKPDFYYAKVLSSRGYEYIVPTKSNLWIKKGEVISILEIIGSRKFGWAADILGWGGENDRNKRYSPQKETYVLIKHDYKKLAKFKIKPSAKIPYAIININGKERKVFANERLRLKKSDMVVLKSAYLNGKELSLDFKGFALKNKINRGDDRNVKISYRELQPEFSLTKKGRIYKIEAKLKRSSQFFFIIEYDL